MNIKTIDTNFCVCKVKDYSLVNFNDNFLFISKTNEENSLVCDEKFVPNNATICEYGWKGFLIDGVLEFSMVGILSKISTILAQNNISIFAISTFNTDYILVKKESYNKALSILLENGYTVI